MGYSVHVSADVVSAAQMEVLGRIGWSLTDGWKLNSGQMNLVFTHLAPTEGDIENLHHMFERPVRVAS